MFWFETDGAVSAVAVEPACASGRPRLGAGQRGGERVVEQGGSLLSALHLLHDLVGAIGGVGARVPYLLH